MKDKSWVKKLSVGDVILHEERNNRGALQAPVEIKIIKIGRKYITGTQGRFQFVRQFDINNCYPDMNAYLAKEEHRKKREAIKNAVTGWCSLNALENADMADINRLVLALEKCGINVGLPEGLQ
ncbi:hypothetical protein R9X49_06490 [Pectobacterium carotovorum]|uniref:beta barrel domain-containing protein n=1 Tax=Pectobacterium carotovorum TaxID=554 RepID=UPI0029DC21B5|nr:hypothetical protein [Pectobacterium carotovorum]MDX6914754.1 hypothetical protein [Pectobacterium carotovorum]